MLQLYLLYYYSYIYSVSFILLQVFFLYVWGSCLLKDHSLPSKYVCSLIFKNHYINVCKLHFFSLDTWNCVIEQTVLRIPCFEDLAQYLQVYIWALWNCNDTISEFLCRSIRNTKVSEYTSEQLVTPLSHFTKSKSYILHCFTVVCIDQILKIYYSGNIRS